MTACHAPAIDPQIDASSKSGFDDIRRGDYVALDSLLAPEIKTPDLNSKLAQIRAYVPNQEPLGRKTIGWNLVKQAQGEETADVSDEYNFGSRLLLCNTHLHKTSSASAWKIEGLHVQSATVRELSVNNFNLAGKTPLQYAFLIATALSPGLMIAALVKVIRAKGLRRKWLWGIAAFVGVFSFQMNWATSKIFSDFLTVQFIGAGAARGASAFLAWVLRMTLPIGAVLILTGVWAKPRKVAQRTVGEAPASNLGPS